MIQQNSVPQNLVPTPSVDTHSYKGWLNSDSFFKRSFSIYGYMMVAGLIITIPFYILMIIIMMFVFSQFKSTTLNIPASSYQSTNQGINNNYCVAEDGTSYGEAPVVYSCCPGLKMVGAFNANGDRIYDVAYCTKCGDGDCKNPENKYSCPEDCK